MIRLNEKYVRPDGTLTQAGYDVLAVMERTVGTPGPPGATGPAGATGATGAPGSTGATGADGSPDTAAQVLAKLLTVDGTASGLDADLLDGLSSAAFATAAHTHAQADVTGLVADLAAKQPLAAVLTATTAAFTTTQETKLAGIAAAATANATDAALRDRSTHTGAQAIATVTGLQSALDAKLDDSQASVYGLTLIDDADAATARTTLGLGTLATQSGTFSGTSSGTNTGDETAAGILAKLITVDGAGSGLDADLLDGISSAGFAAAAHTHALSDLTQSAATTGQVAQWNGTAWAPATAGGGSSVTRIAGASGAAGADITLQKLTADAAANLTTTLATVMTTTGVGVGVWKFQYHAIYQALLATTGADFAINHTGAVSSIVVTTLFPSTGGAAATGIADQIGSNTASMLEGKGARALNVKVGSTLGTDTALADCLMLIEGTVVVTATGSLELRHASELAASTTVKINSNLVLTRIG